MISPLICDLLYYVTIISMISHTLFTSPLLFLCILPTSVKWCLFGYTVEPLLWGHPFCMRKVAFQEGGLSSGEEINTYMYRFTLSSGLSRGGGLSKRGSTVNSNIHVQIKMQNINGSHTLFTWLIHCFIAFFHLQWNEFWEVLNSTM